MIHDNAALATVRIGRRTYPSIAVPSCHVCQSAHRLKIERELVQGRPPSAIIADLPADTRLTARNLTDHARKHLPVSNREVANAMDQDGAERGETMQLAAGHLVDHEDFLRIVVGTVRTRIMAGEEIPRTRDALAAVAILDRITADALDGVQKEDLDRAFTAHFQAARSLMPQAMLNEFVRLLNEDSILAELDTRHRRREEQATTSPVDMTSEGLRETAGRIGSPEPEAKKFIENSVEASWSPRMSTSANSGGHVLRGSLNSTAVTDCRVCLSESLQRANELIMLPRTLPAIAGMMPESGLTAEDLSDHFRAGHVPQSTPVSQ